MSTHLEIEFKNLLTNEEFRRLCDFFHIKEASFISQTNHYFDTEGFALKDAGSALRLREKKGKWEMTLKQPAEVGLLETNQDLDESMAKAFIENNAFPVGEVKSTVQSIIDGIEGLHHFGSLTTSRVEIPYEGGLLVFDHSSYLSTEDFEIEYEVQNFEAGKEIFYNLLNELHIPVRKTENKIKRFYNQKLLQKKSNLI
ncbi:CYTH domain-containing protein [Peribacillus alkalitolerans]|uniref:CYTH domain-containing protein n=1 Tax=Peribacillus alkalitolerans TaxID=1550385 RepID=UPI001967D715|nr:CYTH domain-containing protein [Peribacillus alkalitolerans]